MEFNVHKHFFCPVLPYHRTEVLMHFSHTLSLSLSLSLPPPPPSSTHTHTHTHTLPPPPPPFFFWWGCGVGCGGGVLPYFFYQDHRMVRRNFSFVFFFLSFRINAFLRSQNRTCISLLQATEQRELLKLRHKLFCCCYSRVAVLYDTGYSLNVCRLNSTNPDPDPENTTLKTSTELGQEECQKADICFLSQLSTMSPFPHTTQKSYNEGNICQGLSNIFIS